MQARPSSLPATDPDWRDEAAYRHLLAVDRSLLAWEWLRRTPDYRAAAGPALCPAGDDGGFGRPGGVGEDAAFCRPGGAGEDRGAGAFGLVAFEPPDIPVPGARPLWRRDADRHVLEVERGEGGNPADVFDLGAIAGLATLVRDRDGEHLLLSDGRRAIRLDGPAGTFSAGPSMLRYRLAGVAAARGPLLTLRRFLALCAGDRFAASLHPLEPRARRWILMLRAWDGMRSGADQRALAEHLLSASAGGPLWRSRDPSLRSRAQRLARAARAMAAGGWRELLG